jgi:hypothetical protein
MQADRVKVSWDTDKRKWVVRIEVGLEVIRRYCDLPHDADETRLREAAEKTVADEGYGVDAGNISIAK